MASVCMFFFKVTENEQITLKFILSIKIMKYIFIPFEKKGIIGATTGIMSSRCSISYANVVVVVKRS